ncbi:MAG: hypothetical protein CSA66_03935 [Proteobacteria bacterium]|nr:MAG: hypothetical protein CSA66_03935 [Pseudomonadota bacterium]
MSVSPASPTRRLSLQTPEHVALTFELAPVGNRILAVTIDLMVVVTAVVAVALLASLLVGASAVGGYGLFEVSDTELLMAAIVQLAIFLIWNFYFILTELRWQGRTIGKRVVGLRVVARDGGPLSPGMVFARNLTRDVETLVPLVALFYPQTIGLDSDWTLLVGWSWLGIMTLMPLFNRLRARAGDLIAGTLVVEAPREALLPDLAGDASTPAEAAAAEPAAPYQFTQEQLDLYGIHELQVLEDVLRRYPGDIDLDLLVAISRKIRDKLGWEADDGEEPDAYAFLRAFYAAQRARLEHKMLFGKRQERKVR